MASWLQLLLSLRVIFGLWHRSILTIHPTTFLPQSFAFWVEGVAMTVLGCLALVTNSICIYGFTRSVIVAGQNRKSFSIGKYTWFTTINPKLLKFKLY